MTTFLPLEHLPPECFETSESDRKVDAVVQGGTGA